jgi:hypothetical protein
VKLYRGTGKKLAYISSVLGSISNTTAPDHLARKPGHDLVHQLGPADPG